MSESGEQTLSRLSIPADKKTQRKRGPAVIIGIVAAVVVTGLAVFFATRKGDRKPIPTDGKVIATAAATATVPTPTAPAKPGDAVLTVSGYVVPHARIEISPKFQGTVKWIGVKKGDAVKK